jgi:hypothetical protein
MWLISAGECFSYPSRKGFSSTFTVYQEIGVKCLMTKILETLHTTSPRSKVGGNTGAGFGFPSPPGAFAEPENQKLPSFVMLISGVRLPIISNGGVLWA